MKQVNWNGKDVLLVEVPEDCINPAIIGRKVVDNWADEEWIPFETLPEGDWQFAFAFPLSPTEEEAGEWVDWFTEDADGQTTHWTEYINYISKEWFDNAIESLVSRIRSEGFEQPERVVILTKTQTNG